MNTWKKSLIPSPKHTWSQHNALPHIIQTRWHAVRWLLLCCITKGFKACDLLFSVLLAVSATAVGNVADISWENMFVSVVISSSTPPRTLKKPGPSPSFASASCLVTNVLPCSFIIWHARSRALFALCAALLYTIVNLLLVITNVGLIQTNAWRKKNPQKTKTLSRVPSHWVARSTQDRASGGPMFNFLFQDVDCTPQVTLMLCFCSFSHHI